MQAFLHDLAAEQVHENAYTPEEDGKPQEEELKDGGEHVGVFPNVSRSSVLEVVEGVPGEQHKRSKGQEVDPEAAPGEEGLLQLEPQDGSDLRPPECPRLRTRFLLAC